MTTKEKIYDAALNVFAEFGYKKATMEDIASKVNLTKGALYQYAKSKKALYYKAVQNGMRKWQNSFYDEVHQQTDVKKKFIILAKKSFEYFADNKSLKKILRKDPEIFHTSIIDEKCRNMNNDTILYLRKILKQGINEKKFREIDIEETSIIMFEFYRILLAKSDEISIDTKTMFEKVVDIFTQGLFI